MTYIECETGGYINAGMMESIDVVGVKVQGPRQIDAGQDDSEAQAGWRLVAFGPERVMDSTDTADYSMYCVTDPFDTKQQASDALRLLMQGVAAGKQVVWASNYVVRG